MSGEPVKLDVQRTQATRFIMVMWLLPTALAAVFMPYAIYLLALPVGLVLLLLGRWGHFAANQVVTLDNERLVLHSRGKTGRVSTECLLSGIEAVRVRRWRDLNPISRLLNWLVSGADISKPFVDLELSAPFGMRLGGRDMSVLNWSRTRTLRIFAEDAGSFAAAVEGARARK